MKRTLSFGNLLIGFFAIICIISCSKDFPYPQNPQTLPPSPPTTYVVNATNWIKMSEGNYRCIFYELQGNGNNTTGQVIVYLVDKNVETIISNKTIQFMNGELSAGHDYNVVWARFQTNSNTEALPFSSMKLKIVFE